MQLTWTSQQEQALEAVHEWYEGSEQLYYLAGYAGTGKTTLAKQFAVGIPGPVHFGAFTGKAAFVMQQKGCPNASTIHSLAYQPKDRSRRRAFELERELQQVRELPPSPDRDRQIRELSADLREEEANLRRPLFSLKLDSPLNESSLFVIDECSMIGEPMMEDLLSFGCKILALGDPAQLPPVAEKGYFTERKPDFQLTDIQRQAKGSPIIMLASRVRSGQGLELGTYGSSSVRQWNSLSPDEVLEYDQILCGTNKFRQQLNARMRVLHGRNKSQLPVEGDRLVCLRNDHELGLLNGSMWVVLGTEITLDDADNNTVTLRLKSIDEPDTVVICNAHQAIFLGENLNWYERKNACEFDYGYAITTHKSQGSQWGKVLIFDQSRTFQNDSRKWLYTAITRAADSVTVVI